MIEPPEQPVEYIPPSAPFSAPQRAWLNGFVAGLRAARSGALPVEPKAPATTFTVIYGSQTGTAEALARSFAREAKQRGHAVTVAGMEEFDIGRLPQIERLLVLCSTHGDGDPPDNARDFCEALHADGAPVLDRLRFSVLALGDTNYEQFCRCGHDIDARLEALGAMRLFERIDCDVDVDEPFIRWRDGVLRSVAGVGEQLRDAASAEAGPPARSLGPAQRVAALVRVIENRNLNAVESDKETRHIVLGAGQPGTGLGYEPGDAIAILPFNDPEQIADVLAATGFDADASVTDHGDVMSLAVALKERFTIGRLTAPMLRAFAEHVADAELLALFEPQRRDELHDFLHGRELIDLLLRAPRAFAEPGAMLAMLPRLAPRLYSIASSPRVHKGEVHVTVSTVRYRAHGRERKGVCSTFLGERAEPGALMLAYVQENRRFRLPERGDVPIIMIGPGTGIAPFRAFLHERMHGGAKGRNWLFFGDRCAATDFLYEDELRTLRAAGVLTHLDTAFSRDQSHKVYVQDRMRERSAELWSWLEEGAHVYVCGDAARMAKDVEAALLTIVADTGGLGPGGAETYLHRLKKEQRYQRDVY